MKRNTKWLSLLLVFMTVWMAMPTLIPGVFAIDAYDYYQGELNTKGYLPYSIVTVYKSATFDHYEKVKVEGSSSAISNINTSIQNNCEDFFENVEGLDDVVEADVTVNTSDLFSIKLTSSWRLDGGGQWMGTTYSLNFDPQTGKQLSLSELLGKNKNESLTYIKSETVKYINSHPEKSWADSPENLMNDYDSIERFRYYINDNKIVIHYGTWVLTSIRQETVDIELPLNYNNNSWKIKSTPILSKTDINLTSSSSGQEVTVFTATLDTPDVQTMISFMESVKVEVDSSQSKNPMDWKMVKNVIDGNRAEIKCQFSYKKDGQMLLVATSADGQIAKSLISAQKKNTYSQIDGWPICNNRYSFGYKDDNYKISLSKYKLFFSIDSPLENVSAEILAPLKMISKWNGSCFGLSLLSTANYIGLIDLKSYFSNKGEYLSNYGYTNISQINGEYYYSVENSSTIIDLIEKSQISQISDQFLSSEVFVWDNHFTQLMNYLDSGDADPLIVNMEGVDGRGHSIVIDPSYKPESMESSNYWGKGWYAVRVYDPNVPQNGNIQDNLVGDYERFSCLFLNTNNGKWEFQTLNKNGDIIFNIKNSYQSLEFHRNIKFYDVSSLSKTYFTWPLTTSLHNNMVWFNSSDIDIIGNNDQSLITIKDDTVSHLNKNVDYNIYYENPDYANTLTKYFYTNESSIQYMSPNAEMLILGDSNAVSLSTSGQCKAIIDLKKSDIIINSADNINVNISIKDSRRKEIVTTVKVDNCNELELSFKGGNVDVIKGDRKGIDIFELYEGDSACNFCDVDFSDYFFTAVSWAVSKAITNGTTSTTFSPADTCTRGQAVTFLWRAAGAEKVTDVNNPFNDVKKDAYYYDAVLWAVKNGITNGMTETTFEPDGKCNRGQIVTFLWRTKNKPSSSAKVAFKDVSNKAYYYNPVKWAVEKEVTKGTSSTSFSPDASCTRGQIVTFIYRSKDLQPVDDSLRVSDMVGTWKSAAISCYHGVWNEANSKNRGSARVNIYDDSSIKLEFSLNKENWTVEGNWKENDNEILVSSASDGQFPLKKEGDQLVLKIYDGSLDDLDEILINFSKE